MEELARAHENAPPRPRGVEQSSIFDRCGRCETGQPSINSISEDCERRSKEAIYTHDDDDCSFQSHGADCLEACQWAIHDAEFLPSSRRTGHHIRL